MDDEWNSEFQNTNVYCNIILSLAEWAAGRTITIGTYQNTTVSKTHRWVREIWKIDKKLRVITETPRRPWPKPRRRRRPYAANPSRRTDGAEAVLTCDGAFGAQNRCYRPLIINRNRLCPSLAIRWLLFYVFPVFIIAIQYSSQ